jgi:sRNA-binding carbon storage regulator CsrA
VAVHREEIYERVQQEKAANGQSSGRATLTVKSHG